MKPRQRRSPLTDEDWWIWSTRLTKDLSDDRGLYDTLNQDRRDADLMLGLADARRVCGPTGRAIAHHMLRGQIASDDDMKPRLESAQWTYEDIQIWTAVAERFGAWLTGACCESDSRDANLMLDAQRHRPAWLCCGGPVPKMVRCPDHYLHELEFEAFT
jgi:hypothetical protein